jgi:prepilin-type N-terminal cleavage/methylation domain-containing protein
MSCPSEAGGFTLIELLLVMLIIAVLVGLAVPILSRTYKEATVESLVLSMRKLMVYGRDKALSDGLRYRLTFGSDCATYVLEVEAAHSSGRDDFTKIDGRAGKPNTVPPDILVAASEPQVVIYPDGTFDPVEVVVAGQGGSAYVLRTSGITGRVDVTGETDE